MADQAGTSAEGAQGNAPTEIWGKILKLEEKVIKDLGEAFEKRKKDLEEELNEVNKKIKALQIQKSFSDDEKHKEYLKKYMNSPKKVLLLGMEPGEEAQQTGVPIGDVERVLEWLAKNMTSDPVSIRRKCSELKILFKNDEIRLNFFGRFLPGPLSIVNGQGNNAIHDLERNEYKICENFLQEVVKLLQPSTFKVIICVENFPYICVRSFEDVKVIFLTDQSDPNEVPELPEMLENLSVESIKDNVEKIWEQLPLDSVRKPIWEQIFNIQQELAQKLQNDLKEQYEIDNPFKNEKSKTVCAEFLQRYINNSTKKILILGINPGKEAIETGIAFGNPDFVKEWMGLAKGESFGPLDEKYNVSGKRVCTVLKKVFGTAEKCFETCAMFNVCPVGISKKNGEDAHKKALGYNYKQNVFDRKEFLAGYLQRIIDVLKPQKIICFGDIPNKCVLYIQPNLPTHKLIHPSPYNFKTDPDWLKYAEEKFEPLLK